VYNGEGVMPEDQTPTKSRKREF